MVVIPTLPSGIVVVGRQELVGVVLWTSLYGAVGPGVLMK